MKYYDEKILEARWEEERLKHTTLETGIYVEDDLFTFTQVSLPDTSIRIFLPEQFVPMPEAVKNVKYPSKNAPDFVVTSLDSTVNFGFNLFGKQIEDGDTAVMSRQFRDALRNVNPAIKISKWEDNVKTDSDCEMSWFQFKGYALDGQNFNRMYFIKLKKSVLHGIFNCPMRVKEEWSVIAAKCFQTVEEMEESTRGK